MDVRITAPDSLCRRLAVVVTTMTAVLTAAWGVPRAAEGRASGTEPIRVGHPPETVRYSSPVPGPLHVLRRFDAPPTPYGPGHRGVDLQLTGSRAVLAAADGTVSFAGRVATRDVIVLVHADGIRTEYEPVTPVVQVGDHVRRGDLVGMSTGRHGGGLRSCVHWGARRAGLYLDPLTLLQPVGPVTLLPWTG